MQKAFSPNCLRVDAPTRRASINRAAVKVQASSRVDKFSKDDVIVRYFHFFSMLSASLWCIVLFCRNLAHCHLLHLTVLWCPFRRSLPPSCLPTSQNSVNRCISHAALHLSAGILLLLYEHHNLVPSLKLFPMACAGGCYRQGWLRLDPR